MSVSPATSRISLGSELLRLLHPAAAAALRANFLGGTTGILGLITTVFARRPASRFSVRNGNTGLPSGQYLYPSRSLSLPSSTLISYSLSLSPPSSLTIPRHRHLRHQIIATLSSPSSTPTLSSPTFFHPTSYGLSPTSFVILTTIPPPYPPPLTSEWILTSSLSTPN